MKEQERRTSKKSGPKNQVSHEEVEKAMKEFISHGGQIKVIQPIWIEEGALLPK